MLFTLSELHTLRKEHRCVAVAVKGQCAMVQILGLAIERGFLHQPSEPFRMPLYTQYCFVFLTFYSLDNTVGSCGRNKEMRPRGTDRLMMESVDKQLRLYIYII